MPDTISEPPIVPPHKLSQELEGLVSAFQDRSVAMGELIHISNNRGELLLLIFLNIPFVTPVPIPGLSTPLGLIIAFLGLRAGLAKKPWLPRWLMEWNLPPKFFSFLLRTSGKILKGLETILKPRHTYLAIGIPRLCAGVVMFIAGILLMLPLPFPFTNWFPAWTIILIAAGLIELDGLFILGGWIMFLLTSAYFILLAWAGSLAIDKVIKWCMMFWHGNSPD